MAEEPISNAKARTRFSWLPEHDQMLRDAIERIGGPPAAGQWKTMLDGAVPGRSAKQMRERWRNNLDPSLKFGAWTEDESELLLQLYEEQGSKWSTIAQSLPGESTAFYIRLTLSERGWRCSLARQFHPL